MFKLTFLTAYVASAILDRGHSITSSSPSDRNKKKHTRKRVRWPQSETTLAQSSCFLHSMDSFLQGFCIPGKQFYPAAHGFFKRSHWIHPWSLLASTAQGEILAPFKETAKLPRLQKTFPTVNFRVICRTVHLLNCSPLLSVSVSVTSPAYLIVDLL